MQVRLEQQTPPHLFCKDCRLHGAEAYTAKRFGDACGQPAHFGKLPPDLRFETAAGGNGLAPAESVILLHEAPGVFLEHALLIAQIEIHATPLKD
ncbi:hypothetical protein D3C79_1036970 [compost metagenome]